MINFVHPLPCGNAVALTLTPGVFPWRLVRRLDGDFDMPLTLIEEGEATDGSPLYWPVVDYQSIPNGTPIWYRFDTFENGAWVPGTPVSVTPAYVDDPAYSSPDLTALVQERLDLGLQSELAAGRLRHGKGRIPVLSASPQLEQVTLPVVTAILVDRRSDARGIGETIIPDAFDGSYWSAFEGWLDRSTVQIIAWSLNHEDRLDLRNAIQRILLLNLPILDAAGFSLPDLSSSDTADFETYNAPIYHSAFTLSCGHAVMVRDKYPSVESLEVSINAQAI